MRISPKKIYNLLNRYVYGQTDVKKMLANSVFLHMMRFFFHEETDSINNIKNNSLILGPSGSGKTLMLQVLEKELDMFPICFINAKDITQTGWVGTSIGEFIYYFLDDYRNQHRNSKDFTKRMAYAPYMIVVIDEVDKLCIQQSANKQDDVNKNIQYSLLKAVEGSILTVNTGRNTATEIDTSNMLFIFAGAFEWMKDIRKVKQKIGFNSSNTTSPEMIQIIHQELVKAGMVKELAGRISMAAELKKLSDKELENILLNSPASPYLYYKNLFKKAGIKFNLTKKQIKEILEHCKKSNVGARGLQTGLEKIVAEFIYDCSVDIDIQFLLEEETDNDFDIVFSSKNGELEDLMFFLDDPERLTITYQHDDEDNSDNS